MLVPFRKGIATTNMAARRSFPHTMGKFQTPLVAKPIAILTAWRGELTDPSGQPYPEAIRRRLNEAANRNLKANVHRRGMSYFPVVGAGQEIDEFGNIRVNREMSLIIEPIAQMSDAVFQNHVRELLFNPEDLHGAGPFAHTQAMALLKLTSRSQAFLLSYPGAIASGPHDYYDEFDIGDSAGPRLNYEDEFTQMLFGPRALPAMKDQRDHWDDVGNLNGEPGKRFVIENGGQP